MNAGDGGGEDREPAREAAALDHETGGEEQAGGGAENREPSGGLSASATASTLMSVTLEILAAEGEATPEHPEVVLRVPGHDDRGGVVDAAAAPRCEGAGVARGRGEARIAPRARALSMDHEIAEAVFVHARRVGRGATCGGEDREWLPGDGLEDPDHGEGVEVMVGIRLARGADGGARDDDGREHDGDAAPAADHGVDAAPLVGGDGGREQGAHGCRTGRSQPARPWRARCRRCRSASGEEDRDRPARSGRRRRGAGQSRGSRAR